MPIARFRWSLQNSSWHISIGQFIFDNYVACTVERTPSSYSKSTEALDFVGRYIAKTALLGGKLGYRQTLDIRRILVGDKTVDHSDVVGTLPVGAVPTTSSFSN